MSERIPYNEPQTWYFTFGIGQPNAGHYVVLHNLPGDEARQVMHDRFDRVWGFQYDETDWFKHGVSQADEYGLVELPVEQIKAAISQGRPE